MAYSPAKLFDIYWYSFPYVMLTKPERMCLRMYFDQVVLSHVYKTLLTI